MNSPPARRSWLGTASALATAALLGAAWLRASTAREAETHVEDVHVSGRVAASALAHTLAEEAVVPAEQLLRPRKLLTLAFLVDGDRVLLGMKKRGFGVGRWNGFGGKAGAGERALECALRETREECGLALLDARLVGVLLLFYPTERATYEVHVFKATRASGALRETEEMRPAWFARAQLPFHSMWPDDAFWMPFMLASGPGSPLFAGGFLFTPDMSTITRHWVGELSPSA